MDIDLRATVTELYNVTGNERPGLHLRLFCEILSSIWLQAGA